MLRLSLSRLVMLIPVLLTTILATFALFALTGDPAKTVAGEGASAEQVSAARASIGLDRSFVAQLGDYLANLLRGDMGTSYYSSKSVSSAIWGSIGVTASLAVLSLLFATVIGLTVGTYSARRVGSLLDRLLTSGLSLGLAVPNFWFGILLVSVFSVSLGIFPPGGYQQLGQGVGGWLGHLILPAIALSSTAVAEIGRQTRAAVIESQDAAYVTTARSKGLPSLRVLRTHIMRPAAVPVMTVVGLQLARVLSGTIVIESIFNLPGIGLLLVQSVLDGDRPIVQGIVVVTAILVLVFNLLVDIGYGLFDPRLRESV